MQFKIHNLDIIQQNRKSFTFKNLLNYQNILNISNKSSPSCQNYLPASRLSLALQQSCSRAKIIKGAVKHVKINMCFTFHKVLHRLELAMLQLTQPTYTSQVLCWLEKSTQCSDFIRISLESFGVKQKNENIKQYQRHQKYIVYSDCCNYLNHK